MTQDIGLAALRGGILFKYRGLRGMASSPNVLIIGAGLAGHCCARRLQERGLSFQILEAFGGIGGRRAAEAVLSSLLR